MTDYGNTYICNACGWVYDPEQGDPDGGIAPGTPWEEIPDRLGLSCVRGREGRF